MKYLDQTLLTNCNKLARKNGAASDGLASRGHTIGSRCCYESAIDYSKAAERRALSMLSAKDGPFSDQS